MAAWLTYVKERFPIPVYLLLSGGVATTGLYAGGQDASWPAVVLSVGGLFVWLGLLRLMDELKDYDKDVVAHPERPLPRGLLKLESVRTVIYATGVLQLGIAALCFALLGLPAAVLYVIVTTFLWLMFKEFFIGKQLSRVPILYAVSHQIVLVPLVAFGAAAGRPDAWRDPVTWVAGACALGSFFTYEIARKLDPKAPRVLETYLIWHGRAATTVFLLCTTALAGWAAYRLGLAILLWPLEGLVLATLPLLFFKPEKHKLIEGAATLSLLFHLWAIAARHLTGWPT
ncbi:MAG: UbiA family prenyltransferase [Polyangiaceae bacterium]|jgi:4-hydroxybenzoate polyprenyltransferase|nr:UbiA family prenyltransferase [Polyangiaceae bacterium]